MKRTLAVAVGLALSGAAQAADWSAIDKALLAGAVTMLGADWAQTRYIAAHPDQFREKNPLLGSHPSTGKVNAYFLTAIAGTVGLALVLPATERKWFLGGVTVLETVMVIRNNSIGVGMKF